MQELPKIVLQRLKTNPKSSHPDADTVTAFLEQLLPARERDQVLAHLADCAECREVMALATPPAEVSANALKPRHSGWIGIPALRWAAGFAAIVVLGGVVVLRTQHATNPTTANRVNGHAAPSVAEIKAVPADRSVNTKDNGTDSTLPPQVAQLRSPAENEQPRAKHSKAPAASATRDTAEQVASAEPGPSGRAARPALSRGTPSEMAEMTLPASPKTTMTPDSSGAAPAEIAANDAANSDSAAMELSKAKSPAPVPSAADSSVAGMLVSNAPVAARSARAQMTSPSAQWTVSGGVVQKSIDSGRTWQTMLLAKGVSFRSVAAIGAHVWAGGNAGVLYHSSDFGQHWGAVHPSVPGEILSADVSGIEFSDPQHGKIMTSSGEQWSTSDAGQTWQKQ